MSIQNERLYYANSYVTTCNSVVIDEYEENGAFHVRLRESVFYPTSGGQPNDTGWLNGVPVTDVFVKDGHVYHTVSQRLCVGTEVSEEIDWARRFDFMQQHAGQHILSAAFEQMFDVDTVGFHLGAQWVTVDLNAQSLSWADIERAEHRANEVIWENRRIVPHFATNEELAALRLRHAPKVAEDVRIVTIEGFDDNPCGGTHPAHTGELGVIKVVRAEKMRSGVRLTFVCGARALKDYGHRVNVLRDVGQALSAGSEDLLETVERIKLSAAEAEKQQSALQLKLADYEAKHLAAAARHAPYGVWVCALVPGADVLDLKRITGQLLKHVPAPAACALIGDSEERISVQVATSGNLVEVDAGAIVKSLMADFGGKGGGSAAAAQGSIPRSPGVDATAVRDAAQALLE